MSCSILPSEAVTGLVTLLGVVLGAVLVHRFSRMRNRLELQRDVLRRVIGYRWTLTEGRHDPEGHFFTALNEAIVVFAGDKDVEREIERFHRGLSRGFRAEDLQPLAMAMARSAKVPSKAWKRELFERPFTPPLEASDPGLSSTGDEGSGMG